MTTSLDQARQALQEQRDLTDTICDEIDRRSEMFSAVSAIVSALREITLDCRLAMLEDAETHQ